MRTRAMTSATTAAAAAVMMTMAGCGNGRKAQARADARASGFVPPSVTSRLDYGSMIERRFRALDRNGDEFITPDELPRADSRLMTLDRNHDGRISAAEWSEGMMARFDREDANHDGSVTSTERDAARTHRGS